MIVGYCKHVQEYLDLAGELFVGVDVDGFVSHVNSKACSVLGYTEEEILGKNWFDTFVPPGFQSSIEDISADLLLCNDCSESKRHVNPVLTRSGEERVISWHNMVMRDADGKVVGHMSSGEDITEQLKANEALVESEIRYRKLFDEAAEGILVLGIESQRVRSSNPAVCSFFGYSLGEIVQLQLTEMHPEGSLEFVQGELRKQINNQQKVSCAVPCLRKDGEVVYADIKCSFMEFKGEKCLVGYFTDVTDRIHSKEMAKESEEKYQLVVETVRNGIQENDLSGTITFSNQACCELFGYTREDFVGRKIWDTFAGDPNELEDYLAYLVDVQPTPTPYTNIYVRKDDCKIVVQVDWNYKYNSSGVLVGFISILTDITEREETAKSLADSEAKYRLLVEASPHGIHEVDLNGVITYANPTSLGFYGYSYCELVGKRIWDQAESPDKSESYFQSLLRDRPAPAPYYGEYLNKEGERFQLQVDWDYLHDAQGDLVGFISIQTDITERLKIYNELRSKESQLRAIMNSLRETSIVIYEYDGRVANMWDESDRDGRYGIKAEDMVGKYIHDILPPAQADERLKQVRQVITSGDQLHSEHVNSLPGGEFWFSSTLSPLVIDNEPTVSAVGILHDITKRRKTDEALQKSESRFRAIMNSLRDVSVVLYDYEGRVDTVWSDKSNDIRHGTVADDFVGKSVLDILQPEAARKRLDSIQHVINFKAKVYTEEFRALPGGEFWFDVTLSPLVEDDGSVSFAVGFLRDVTARKRAESDLVNLNTELESIVLGRTNMLSTIVQDLKMEVVRRKALVEELHLSQERYRSFVESSKDWIWEKDLSFRHIYSNNQVGSILGFSPEEIMGIDFTTLIHPEDKDQVAELFAECTLKKQGWSNLKKRIRHRDGGYRILESNSTPIVNEEGELIGFRGVDRDITNRIQAEEELANHQSILEHVSRMSTMGATVSGLAHEINQPLSALAVYADACSRMIEPKMSVDLSDTLTKISEQAERAGKIIQRVQQFARKGGLHSSTFDINHIVHESMSFFETEAKLMDVKCHLVLSDSISELIGDPIQIQQVLLNLIRNAFDSMKRSGLSDNAITIRSVMDKFGHVQIDVQDTGAGFSSSRKDQLFDSFYTTKTEGMGLGLSISRSIIEAHGGQLVASSDGDRGATFSITLPVEKRSQNDRHEINSLYS